MKRVLLDQGLAPRAAALLRERGWDAIHVSEIGLATADDLRILHFARETSRTCITLDHDFHTNLALTRAGKPSIVLLRVQKLDAAKQAALICDVWDVCEAELLAGAAVSADDTTVRVRRLPLR